MSAQQYHLKFGGSAAESVDAYLEYKRIVGDDDGGTLFTPKQYEEYKKRVIPMRLKNRLYTAWVSSTLMDCKLIGPETMCFCQHRYREHKTDFENIPSDRPILLPCRVKNCRCVSYHYLPLNGSQPIRCRCKHLSSDHREAEPYLCKNESCKCEGFTSSYTCGCGEAYHQHSMVVESREERVSRGHPVGRDVPYQAMGGLTGFSSLMDGYMRLDPSGAGAPPLEFLNQPITSSDHPFLRGNVESIKADRLKQRAIESQTSEGSDLVDEDLSERMSALRSPGETDMDYFERRYQERLKAEKRQARGLPAAGRLSVGKRNVTTIKLSPSTRGADLLAQGVSAPFSGPSNVKSTKLATKSSPSTRGPDLLAQGVSAPSSGPSNVKSTKLATKSSPSTRGPDLLAQGVSAPSSGPSHVKSTKLAAKSRPDPTTSRALNGIATKALGAKGKSVKK